MTADLEAKGADDVTDDQPAKDGKLNPITSITLEREDNVNMKELIEYMAKALVDDPDSVRVEEIEGTSATIYELRVAPEDMGRVIGKQGRVANAMRTLLRAAAARQGRRVTLEIV
jgi:predicted RNA-binding protein YlqC (UPF0109 family)